MFMCPFFQNPYEKDINIGICVNIQGKKYENIFSHIIYVGYTCFSPMDLLVATRSLNHALKTANGKFANGN